MLRSIPNIPDAGGQPDRRPGCVRNLGFIGGIFAAVILASPVHAQAPAAGTVIGNQATATYEDASGQTFTVSSNLVETTINQVVAVDIEADTSKMGTPGGFVFFPHTITNTGNGSDIFDITTDLPTANLTLVGIYPDADLDGVPDVLTPIAATPTLAAGQSFGVVVQVEVGNGIDVTTPTAESYDITATTTTAAGPNITVVTPSDTNTDTVTGTNGPVIDLTKSMVLKTDTDGSGSITPGDVLTARITYKNTGAANATNVTITDDMTGGTDAHPGDELTYVAGSGVWSDGGTLTDDSADTFEDTNGTGDQIDYRSAADVVTAVISNVPAGREGYVEFDVTIDDTASGNVYNEASVTDDVNTTSTPSNEASVSIITSTAIGVTLADSSTTDALDDAADLPDGNLGGADVGTNYPDTDGDTANDTVQANDTVPEGATVNFEFVIENHSAVPEFFNLSAVNVDFPAGTTFSITRSNGVPLLDSDGNGQVDLQVAANTATTFLLKATLPAGSAGDYSTTPVTATVTAASQSNPAETNSSTAEFAGEVVEASVDLENGVGGGAGGDDSANVAATDDDTNAGAPWTTINVVPGGTAIFDLWVENNGLAADSYNLTFGDTSGTADSNAGLPAGWQVVFKDASGNTITNTGVLQPGNSADLTAEVTVPASATPATTNIWFRVVSATNGTIEDMKLDAVTVDSIIDLQITPDRTAQASPGGTVVMTHTLANLGNVGITDGALSYTTPFPTFSETLYVDANGNGVLDVGTDPVVTSIADVVAAMGAIGDGDAVLDASESVTLFSRVQVPSTSVAGVSETATIDVGTALTDEATGSVNDGNPDNNTVTETVTVVSGDVEVVKQQGLDVACDGTVDGGFQITRLAANPGECIIYQVTATNTGTADALNVNIDDVIPAWTTLNTTLAPTPLGGTAPALKASNATDGGTGTFGSTHGTLAPGQQATLTFMVQIDQ